MEELRALVVEDNDDIAEFLALLLQRNGYQVEIASSGAAAIAAIDKVQGSESFCLIISDIGMPGMNGYELARTLRHLPECETVVMIALTGYSIYEDRARALRAGFDGLIVKPVGPRSLMATIERLQRSRNDAS